MKKFLLAVVVLVLALIGLLAFAWVSKTSLAASFLSRELGVPVTIQSLNFSKRHTDVKELWIGNPSHSKTKTAFSCKQIDITGTWKEFRGNPLTIEDIVMKDIVVGIEQYSKEKHDTNWSYILKPAKESKKGSRDYVIQKLVVRNLTIQLTKSDGSVQTFPTIEEMTFYNISSDSGFPIRDIEKAIFNKMLREALLKFNLNEVLDSLVPGGSPLKYIPLFG